MDVVSNIRVEDMSVTLGVKTQSISCDDFHLLNSNMAFKISSMTKDERHDENHFRRFIRFTPLKAIHWINFSHDKVVFKTIIK